MRNSEDLFNHVGFSKRVSTKKAEVIKIRLATNVARRIKQLSRTDTNINFFALPYPMTKKDALDYMSSLVTSGSRFLQSCGSSTQTVWKTTCSADEIHAAIAKAKSRLLKS